MKLLECFQPFGVLDDPTKDLRASREELKKRILLTTKKMEHARRIYDINYWKKVELKKSYRKTDFELAKLDGRYKVVKPFKPEKKRKEKKKERKAFERLLDKMTKSQKLELIEKMERSLK